MIRGPVAEIQLHLEKIAREILVLSRNTLLVNLRFLDAALSQFIMMPYNGTCSVLAGVILFDPEFIIESYRVEKEAPVRAYLHMVLHCVFQHPFGAPNLDQELWNLSCDIAVEYTISELGLKACETKKSMNQYKVFDELKMVTRHRLTAEQIYRYYNYKQLQPKELHDLKNLFYQDDHDSWYWTEKEKNEKFGDNTEGEKGDIESTDQNQESDKDAEGKDAEKIWKEIAERMQTEMETFAKEKGDKASNLVQNLREINREKVDYSEFLRKFSVLKEAIKVNDDEFDYIYYTYGLSLYKNMPLVEPLEYQEVRKISEFVIAIDTSGSVSGKVVQSFVQKTYDILKNTESFFSKVNIRIIQCDSKIQSEVKITSEEQFDHYINNMELKGFGGTDFRPVFDRVDELIQKRELTELNGLIYFTDGYGTFPTKIPPYKTAFVFVDEGYNNPHVPSWAIKAELDSEDI